MRCVYYISPTLKTTHQISEDLGKVGVNDWFVHVVSKDESGLSKQRLHSSNYLETLDVIRDGLIGAGLGFVAGVFLAILATAVEPFGPNVPWYGYAAIVVVLSCFGAWVGGLTGIASENKKLATFNDEIDAGKYIILIYAKADQEAAIKRMMDERYPEVKLGAVDPHFLNPFATLKAA